VGSYNYKLKPQKVQDNSHANSKVVVKARLAGLEWYLLSNPK